MHNNDLILIILSNICSLGETVKNKEIGYKPLWEMILGGLENEIKKRALWYC